MSSIVAYGQQDCNTADSVRTIQKAYYFFNQDSTTLTYVYGGDVMNYYIKDEVKLAEVKRDERANSNFTIFMISLSAIIGICYILSKFNRR